MTLLDTYACTVIDPRRAIKNNFSQTGYTLCELPTGEKSDWLDQQFKLIETTVLGEIRKVDANHAGPKDRAAVANLFALHLVRNEGFRRLHADVVETLRVNEVPRLASGPGVIAAVERDRGRPPEQGEIEALAERLLERAEASKRLLTDGMARQHDTLAEKLNRWSMQVVSTEPPLPGFVLGDVPVVHADTQTERFGFRDGLALGDADLIMGPVTRRVAVFFTATRIPHAELKARKLVDLVNSMSWKASLEVVACHPNDRLATLQMARRIDRYPARLVHRS